jgi:hypothetical protein
MSEIHKLREELRYEMAEIMLLALKKEGGVYLSNEAYYKLIEKVADALRGEITV